METAPQTSDNHLDGTYKLIVDNDYDNGRMLLSLSLGDGNDNLLQCTKATQLESGWSEINSTIHISGEQYIRVTRNNLNVDYWGIQSTIPVNLKPNTTYTLSA
jgi:hypothetical protein